MKQKLIALGSAACLLAGLGAYAEVATAVSQSFEDGANDALVSTLNSGNVKWTGYGYITNYGARVYGTDTTKPDSGLPISGDHNKTVLVEGQMACTTGVSSVSGGTSTDFMVKLTAPDEPLADLTDSTIQVALATATNGVDATKVDLKLWCKAAGQSTASWVTLLESQTADVWARVTLNFSYESTYECCQVLVDGNAVCTASGYLATNLTTTSGSWYKLANVPSDGTRKTINSIEVKGMTELDDLVVKTGLDYASYKPYVDANGYTITNSIAAVVGGEEIPVDKNDMLKWGVNETTISTAKIDSTNPDMTVMQELAAGIDPDAPVEFVIQDVAVQSAKVVLTVPALTPPDGYENVIAVAHVGDSSDDPAQSQYPITSGVGTVEVPLPIADTTNGKASKFTYQIKTVTVSGD